MATYTSNPTTHPVDTTTPGEDKSVAEAAPYADSRRRSSSSVTDSGTETPLTVPSSASEPVLPASPVQKTAQQQKKHGAPPRRLTSEDIPAAARCLAEAFKNDAVARYFVDCPDTVDWSEEKKYGAHMHVMVALLDLHLVEGVAMGIESDDPERQEQFDGIALWVPPHTKLGYWPLTQLRTGLWRLRYRLSATGSRRFFRSFIPLLVDTKHEILGAEEDDSWYLVYLASHPDARGKGVGKRLVQWGIEQADQDKSKMYLESSAETNLMWYQRLGFEIVKRIELRRDTEEAVPLDVMTRKPQ